MKIGVMVESFRLYDFRKSIEAAATLGAHGVQAYATDYGYMPFDKMTPEKIREHLDIVKSNGIVFSAICGDFGVGFEDEERNLTLVDNTKRVMELAKELECDIVTTHIGRIPEKECHEKEVMRRALNELSRFASSMGSSFAMETGTECGHVMADFLRSLDGRGVKVNFDPANLVMVADDRPEVAVKALGEFIVHTHAKDGIMLKAGQEQKVIIGDEAKDHEALMDMGMKYLELPLGEGGVNFDTYLPALAATGFNGFLTVEREVGASPMADIELAVNFLKEKIEKYNLA